MVFALALATVAGARAAGAGGATASEALSSWTERCVADCRAPAGRAWAPMAYDVATGSVVLFGGVSSTFMADTWTWDGLVWRKETPPSAPASGAYGAMAYDPGTQSVLLFNAGGQTWLWNGVTKRWTQQTPKTSPPPRYFAAMALDPATETVVLFGGGPPGQALNDTWVWSGAARKWTRQTPAASPPARYGATMAADPATGKVVLFGGFDAASVPLGDTWIWNGSARTWSKQTPLLSPRARGWAAMTSEHVAHRIVLFGGGDGSVAGLRGDTWTWDGGANTWIAQPAAGPEPRQGAGLAYDPTSRGVVLFGGVGIPEPTAACATCVQTRYLDDTWAYTR